jgi:ligand-binding sensor domain-containing protein
MNGTNWRHRLGGRVSRFEGANRSTTKPHNDVMKLMNEMMITILQVITIMLVGMGAQIEVKMNVSTIPNAQGTTIDG